MIKNVIYKYFLNENNILIPHITPTYNKRVVLQL